MKPIVMSTLLVAAVLAVLATSSAEAGRPGDLYSLEINLNGNPTRWTLPDGGQSGIFSATSPACMALKGGTLPGYPGPVAFVPSVILFEGQGPFNICSRPTAGAPVWDGGCNTIDTDINFGVPLQAWVPQYMTLDTIASQLCASSDGGSIRIPVWAVQ